VRNILIEARAIYLFVVESTLWEIGLDTTQFFVIAKGNIEPQRPIFIDSGLA
jgi:hypothetical protein